VEGRASPAVKVMERSIQVGQLVSEKIMKTIFLEHRKTISAPANRKKGIKFLLLLAPLASRVL
jgi:hypothetical protein